MKNIFLLIFCLLIVFLQMSVLGNFFSAKRMPDLILVFALILVISLKFEGSLLWLVALGFFADASSLWQAGITPILFLLLGVSIEKFLLYAEIRSSRPVFLIILGAIIAVAKIAFDFFSQEIFRLLSYYEKQPLKIQTDFLNLDYLCKIIYTILFGYAIYYVFRKISRKLFVEPVRIGR